MSVPHVDPLRPARSREGARAAGMPPGRPPGVAGAPVAGPGFGPHLVFDGYGCPAERLDDLDALQVLLESLPGRIHTTSLMAPCVYRHATPGRGSEGLSGFALTSESHISVHTYPQRHFLDVDVFSCRPFDVEVVLAALKEAFAPRRVEWKLLERGLEPAEHGAAARAPAARPRARAPRGEELEASS